MSLLKPVPCFEDPQVLLDALRDLFIASDMEAMKTVEGEAELRSARQQARVLLRRHRSF